MMNKLKGHDSLSFFGALALISLLVLGGCGGGDEPPPSAPGANNSAIDAGSGGDDATGGGDVVSDAEVEDGGSDAVDVGGGPPSCTDECAEGTQTCDARGGYRVCGQYDLDACLELSPPVACAEGYECEAGRCVAPCRDMCAVGGAICGDGDTVLVCGNFDSDRCRESGAAVDCAAGERCEQGACVDEGAACTDECAAAGETVCFGDTVRTCGSFDADGCLDLGPPAECGRGESCAAGQCVSACVDECAREGASECVGDGARVCGDADNDGCLEWSEVEPCEAGDSCSRGECSASCVDECASAGQPVCSEDGAGVAFCGDYDSDICLDRASAIPCPPGFGCANGVCVATCTDECSPGSAPQCGADGKSLQTCGDFDDDPCYELGGAVACPGGADCTSGACEVACQDECAAQGEAECTAAGDGVRLCGQYDLDGCLEWSVESACEVYEVCQAGACELGATPAALVINEFSVDSPGLDAAAGNTLFVELWGPAGTSLDGWSVVGVNGSDGSDYNAIGLSGEVVGQDGYFVIAHPDGAAEVKSVADITDTGVDFQNGPDSIQLRWRGRVVDAVGYGSFSGGSVFAGEGSAASLAGAAESLSRDMGHTDTDDNGADFSVLAVPTPREMTTTCVDDCQAGATRCDRDEIQTCVQNGDADDCYEWGPSMACATTGETCVAGSCQAPCADECAAQGATQCAGADVQTCGNYDADACLEWSSAVACPSSGETCVVDSCQDPTAPEVVMITPQGTLQTTQGDQQRVLVDATPTAGRTISAVRYYADGVEFASTTSTPHEAFFVVPGNHPTNTQITLQAKAEDNTGLVGSSSYAYLDVRNDAPLASFTATITNTTTVTVDASSSTDTESGGAALEVCWDWNNDGTCETPFSTNKVETYDFGTSGTYTIRMVVRDEVGQTDETTRQVSFADIQYIGGQSVTSTLWYGTIIITGDVTVPAGQTLTIAEGTDVLFVFSDVGSDGTGDYMIDIDGELVVNGTAANPVVFSGQDTTAKVPGGWDRISISGPAPSTIKHAIFEYADVGLQIFNGSTLEDVEVRQTSGDCLVLDNADNASLTRVEVHDCAGNGVRIRNGSNPVAIDDLKTENNAENGVFADGGSLVGSSNVLAKSNGGHGVRVGVNTRFDAMDSTFEDNSGAGLRFETSSTGDITQNQIRNNGLEGIGFFDGAATGSPSPKVTYNNIYSNAVTGSTVPAVYTTSATLSAAEACCSSDTSALWSVPGAGEFVRRVYVDYDEYYSDNSVVYAQLLDQSGGVIRTFPYDFTGWVEVGAGVTGLRVRVYDTGRSSTEDTITAGLVETYRLDGAADVVSAHQTGTIDVRYNYLGTFPNVLSRVEMTRRDALDLQGFVGQAFTSAWDTGIYKAGEVGGESWSGTIVVTGNVAVSPGEVLDVAAGTLVEFVNHDQDLDGVGDWTLSAEGALDVNGAVGNEVVFSGYGGVVDDMFDTIEVLGSAGDASAWTDAIIRNAQTGLTLMGPHTMTRVQVFADSGNGVEVLGSEAPVLDEFTVDGAGGHGFLISGSGADVNRALVRDNAGAGFLIEGGAVAVIEDSTIRDNGSDGVHSKDASPQVNHNLLTYNGGYGVRVTGTGSPSADYNIIKFNDDAGVGVWDGASATSPTPRFNYSNIYGNSVVGTTIGASYSTSTTLSAEEGCCSSDTSALWSAPAGEEVRRVYVTYDEYYSNNSVVYAQLLDQLGNIVKTFPYDFSGWVVVDPGVTGLRVRVYDTGRSSTMDTITASTVETTLTAPDAHELSAATTNGTTDAKFNYWTPTIGDVPTKIYETRAGAVDYTGFTGAEYPSGPVSSVGPRP